MRMRRGWHPGTRTKLYYDGDDRRPDEGDLMASPAGASYLILRVRESRTIPGRVYLDVERLPYGSVDIEGDGVWPILWYSRSRRVR